ncbi:MAG: hypothetical protein WBG73_04615 [Coleofasciculaceae cyanobacterium]
MRRQNERIKLKGNRFKVIIAVTIAASACAFAFGAFMALQTTEKRLDSTTPETPIPSPVEPTAATPVRKPKSVPSASATRSLPPPNTQNQQDPYEDRD